jgi:hypothetical protein
MQILQEQKSAPGHAVLGRPALHGIRPSLAKKKGPYGPFERMGYNLFTSRTAPVSALVTSKA